MTDARSEGYRGLNEWGNDLVILHNVRAIGRGRRGPFNDGPAKYELVLTFDNRHLHGLMEGLTALYITTWLKKVFTACTGFPNSEWESALREAYVAAGIRPLTVSDVVVLDGKAWRVEKDGWSEYDGQPLR